jgi:hypothetical protein
MLGGAARHRLLDAYAIHTVGYKRVSTVGTPGGEYLHVIIADSITPVVNGGILSLNRERPTPAK